jgi:hypothetical protein
MRAPSESDAQRRAASPPVQNDSTPDSPACRSVSSQIALMSARSA